MQIVIKFNLLFLPVGYQGSLHVILYRFLCLIFGKNPLFELCVATFYSLSATSTFT